jgi:uncharacterized SAM-binding protein YcdF (DUF218 family)
MSAPSTGKPSRRRGLGTLLIGATLALALALLWRPALRGGGAALIAEDSLAPADVIVVSGSTLLPDAFEAARLYRDGYAPRVLVPGAMPEPYLDDVRALGIARRSAVDLARTVLERSGVPAAAIEIVSDPVDGTEAEAAVIAAFVARQRPQRLLIVTARTHGARTRWLLRHLLPAQTALIVRSPADDPFQPDAWWHSRESARETMAEYLRWANTLLGDLWR